MCIFSDLNSHSPLPKHLATACTILQRGSRLDKVRLLGNGFLTLPAICHYPLISQIPLGLCPKAMTNIVGSHIFRRSVTHLLFLCPAPSLYIWLSRWQKFSHSVLSETRRENDLASVTNFLENKQPDKMKCTDPKSMQWSFFFSFFFNYSNNSQFTLFLPIENRRPVLKECLK